MIPSKPEIETKSTMVGEKISMGIDEKSLAFIQSILTDLYSDQELAVIREYSTNARDAHLEAGHKKPIEIKTPNAMNPSFTVKDYGVGLSLEDIRKVYSLYGASTKRESKEQNGMLGLGSKSALTYTSQFTVKAVKDGRLTSVLVTRDETGASSMQILQEVKTDQPNGVEITVPTKPNNSFLQKTKDFFKYWIDSPVPVLINGESPKFAEANWVTENIAIIHEEDYYSRNVYVHMAGVTYKLRDYSTHGMGVSNFASIVFFVEPGSVDFTPNREDLMYTTRTKAVIEKFSANFREGLKAAVARDIKAATSAEEALAVFKQWKKKVSFHLGDTVKWNGLESPDAIEWKEWYSVRYSPPNFYAKENKTAFMSLPDNIVIVTGKTTMGISNPQRAKLRSWLEEELEASGGDFIFLEDDEYSPWTDGFHHVTWQEILSVKVSSTKTNLFRTKPEHYKLSVSGGRHIIDPKTSIDATKPIAYASLKEIDKNGDMKYGSVAGLNGIQFILIPKPKIKAFTNRYPTAKHYKKAFVDGLHEVYNSFTEDEIEAVKEDQFLKTVPQMFYMIKRYKCYHEIIDPEIKSMVDRLDSFDYDEFARTVQPKLVKLQEFVRVLSSGLVGDKWQEYYELAWRTHSSVMDVGERYPLISSIWTWNEEIAKHAVIYINGIYENNQKEKDV